MADLRRIRSTRVAGLGAALAGVIACAASATAVAAPALLGQWRFDETDQTAHDDGPYGLDGRLGHSLAADPADPARIAGISDGALRFDGGSLVRLPDSVELAPETLSVEAVVRGAPDPGQWRYVVSRGGQGCFAGAYGLYTAAAGGIAFYVFDGTRYVVTATAEPEDVWDGAWHHVAGTFDGDRLQLYRDGSPVGDPADGQMRIDYAGTTMSGAFGRYLGSCDLSYSGDLDLVRIWSGALDAGEVAESAAREVHPGEPLPTQLPPPVRAADPPTRLDAPPGGRPAACTLRLSRKRIVARRRTPVRVRVTARGKPVRAVRVVARRSGKRKPITAARTGARGRARLVLRVRRPGQVRISAARKPGCSPGYIRVARGS